MTKKSRRQRKWEKKALRQAVRMELQEHRSSFLVFNILRLLILVTLIRQIQLGSYESAFFCSLTLLFLYVPSWIQVKLRIELPPALEISLLCFIFAAEILGEVNAFYVVIPGWDTMLHTINGFLSAAVGFSLVTLLNDDERLTFDLSPFFLVLMAFCFSMTIGVLWEFFEFFMDLFLHTDMQKDTVIHAIHSVALDSTHSNQVIHVDGIHEVQLNGTGLPLDGYLDIGLIDTMKDLFVNFLGAVFFSAVGYLYLISKGKRQTRAQAFVPTPKAAGHDFLQQARRSALPPSAEEDPPQDLRETK